MKSSYNWKFTSMGGNTRVLIEKGQDIVHLGELDQKMWTVLSCPTVGLEFDEATLKMLDADGDGKIRVKEVTTVTDWLKAVLKDPEILIEAPDTLALDNLNQETPEGKRLYESAWQILKNLKLEKNEISLADTADSVAIFAETAFNGDGLITVQSTEDEALKQTIEAVIAVEGSDMDRCGQPGVNAERIEAFYTHCAELDSWYAASEADPKSVFPYGEHTAEAYNAYKSLKDKVEDYFVRCKLVAFDELSSPALNVSTARVEAVSGKNLSSSDEEIASYPLAHIGQDALLPLDKGINPAWEAVFNTFKTLVADVDFAGKESLTQEEWNTLAVKFAPYEAWMADAKGQAVETLGLEKVRSFLKDNHKEALLKLVEQDNAMKDDAESIDAVDRLLHYCRHIYEFVRNYVTFYDFYSFDKNQKAVFQAGTLYIDQRSCNLCLKVSDMGKHNATAGLSGMYLLYCDCVCKEKPAKMTIVAVLTDGDVNDLREGKNAVFVDRQGLDWDAVVVKIIDNPISIRQAFWSPYRKFGRFISDQVSKFASSQDEKVTGEGIGKISKATENVANAEAAPAPKQPFDIAKFCGIFAAIGLALGYIGGFLLKCFTGLVSLKWWGIILVILGIILLISGPAMLLAWTKLRKRNLSHVLNANGWAINAGALVSIPFGNTLTDMAGFPMVKVKDPYAVPKTFWRKALDVILILGVLFCILFFTNCLSRVGLPSPKARAAAAAAAAAQDSIEMAMQAGDTLQLVVEEVPAAVEEVVAEEAPAE